MPESGSYEVRPLDHPEKARVVTILDEATAAAMVAWLTRMNELEAENLHLKDVIAYGQVA
jgi:hypothetical protein